VNRQQFVETYGFELDGFQERALDALDAGRSVLVAAPTGSGKTLVAEYAVAKALDDGAKAFYTTPLKALSNQKFGDLVRRHGPGSGQMDRVEAAQRGAWRESARVVEDVPVERDLVDPSKQATCVGNRLGAPGSNCPHEFRAGERRSHADVIAMAAQVPSQDCRLRLLLDELHECRRVEVQLHRSSARASASAAEASMP